MNIRRIVFVEEVQERYELGHHQPNKLTMLTVRQDCFLGLFGCFVCFGEHSLLSHYSLCSNANVWLILECCEVRTCPLLCPIPCSRHIVVARAAATVLPTLFVRLLPLCLLRT